MASIGTDKDTQKVRYDAYGKIRFMIAVEGYVMCRRPRCSPFVLSEKDWEKLPVGPVPEGLRYPAVHGDIVFFDDPLAHLKGREQ